MDFATLIGFFCACLVISVATLFGGSFSLLIDFPSILIVFIGSASIALIRYSISQFVTAMKLATTVVFHKSESIPSLINQLIYISTVARKDGILALEKLTINDRFLKRALRYVVDGIDPQIIEHTLQNDLLQTYERNMQSQQVFKTLAEIGPGMGMIGTLIGLVKMLSQMNDPKHIGPAMAIAMLTTLYGAILANIIANPIAGKLEMRSEEERIRNLMIIDAILAIQKKQNPIMIRELLDIYLPRQKPLHQVRTADE